MQQADHEALKNARLSEQIEQLKAELHRSAGGLLELETLREEAASLKLANAELKDTVRRQGDQLFAMSRNAHEATKLIEEADQWREEATKLQMTQAALKKELFKLTSERDQLVEISSSLKAEVQASQQSLTNERVLQLESHLQSLELQLRDSIPTLPKYDVFEKISITPPEREEGLGEIKHRLNQVKGNLEGKSAVNRRYR